MEMILFVFLIALGAIFVPPIRQALFTRPIFLFLKKKMPTLSDVEKQMARVGTESFESEIFFGAPRWDRWLTRAPVTLTEEETSYLHNQASNFCASLDEWAIRKGEWGISDLIWEKAKEIKLFGLRVPKTSGGLGFSAQAQSTILGLVASRSIDFSVIPEVMNSLSPDELIEQYGTDEQKKHYMNRFANGEEIPCFAITSTYGGSDIASMHDSGEVVTIKKDGGEILGIKVSWSKRYITLAPRATLIVLAFNLKDPEHLLGEEVQRGITLALIPTSTEGVRIGNYHLPSGSVFPNGPIQGDEVIIPLEWVVGGKEGIGIGWTMIVETLASGRGVSVPSMSVATTKFVARVVTAYAKVRRQFGKSIATFEGVNEIIARIVEAAYVSESAREITASLMSSGERPLVISSIMKYKMTDIARHAINDAMDVHGGKAVMDGPSNYLQAAYQMIPIAVTAEGSNVITRSLIITGQSIVSSHPFFKKVLFLLSEKASPHILRDFENAIFKQCTHYIQNLFFAFWFNLGGSRIKKVPGKNFFVKFWLRKLDAAVRTHAVLTDTIVFLYQGNLKKRQKVSGRIADNISELYILSCVIKRFYDEGCLVEHIPFVDLVMKNGIARFYQTSRVLVQNIPLPVRFFLYFIVFPFGLIPAPANDKVQKRAVDAAMKPGSARDALIKNTFLHPDPNDPVRALEDAFLGVQTFESILNAIDNARHKNIIPVNSHEGAVTYALKNNLITKENGPALLELYKKIDTVLRVDEFTQGSTR